MDPGDPNRMISMLAREVGVDRDVLVLSAGTRDLAVLEEGGCRLVHGYDGNDDWESALRKLEGTSFDMALLDRTLETSAAPLDVLRAVRPLLRPGGRLLVTADNVLHGARRLALLSGVWSRNADANIERHLDAVSLAGLLHAAGFQVDTITATVVDPLAAGELPVRDLPADVVEWVRDQPGAYERELLVVATPGTTPHGMSDVKVDPAVEPAAVRRRDAYTRAALGRSRELSDLRHRMLTMRDHVIGLEAETVTARLRQQSAEVRANRATARAERLKARVDKAERKARRSAAKLADAQRTMRRNRRELQKQLTDLRASRSYRAGRVLTAPLRPFRKG